MIQAHSYLLFYLCKEKFAIDVSFVTRVIDMENMMKIPKAPDFVKGVINLEGNVMPIIDLAKKVNLGETSLLPKTKVIVLEIINEEEENFLVGMLVDEVLDVVDAESAQLKSTPVEKMGFDTYTLDGMLKVDEEFFMILNARRVFEKELAHFLEVDKTI